MIYTRQEYMKSPDEGSHDRYYGQFVNDSIKQAVIQGIGKAEIENSKDEHFNDIPLKKWDALAGYVCRGSNVFRIHSGIDSLMTVKFEDAGDDCPALSDRVCVLKAAARQIKEGSYNGN